MSTDEVVEPEDISGYTIKVNAIARRVLFNLVEAEIGDLWGDYPEINERDWKRITDRVQWLVSELNPSQDVFDAAYKYLDARADAE